MLRVWRLKLIAPAPQEQAKTSDDSGKTPGLCRGCGYMHALHGFIFTLIAFLCFSQSRQSGLKKVDRDLCLLLPEKSAETG